MKHILNRHLNKHTKRYRYKMISTETDKLIKYFYCATNLGYCHKENVRKPTYVYVRYDYKPYFLYVFIWYFKSLYKQPSTKQKRLISIASTISKTLGKVSYWLITLLVIVLGALIWAVYEAQLIKLWHTYID